MKKPIIGITTTREPTWENLPATILLKAYSDAILLAGGIPFLLPSELPGNSIPQLMETCQGFLFTGGGDIAVERYAGPTHPRVHKEDPLRDQFEMDLLHAVIDKKRPFLGICRGLQMLNVFLGGTLYAHIPDQKTDAIKHDYYPKVPRDLLAHQVVVAGGSRLKEITGVDTLRVNSLHHQGIQHLAPSLIASAFAPDGLVEAVELPEHPFGIAVQWHPEWLTGDAHHLRLFQRFTAACASSNTDD